MAYTVTANALIAGALKDLGVLAAGETLGANDAADGREALNQLADALGLDRLLLYRVVRTTKTLASGTASYTIGTGASISVARPLWISHAGLIQDTAATDPLEVPIDVLEAREYAAWPFKTQQSTYPRAVWYDTSFDSSGFGLIYPLPIPDVGTTQLVLYTPGGHVSQFADGTTEYLVPSGWARMLRKTLALEIAPMFPAASVPSGLVRQASDALAACKRGSVRPISRQSDPALTGRGGWFDIETGQAR